MVLDGEVDTESRSLSQFAGDVYTAAMLLHDLLHNGQSQPSASLLRREEGLKDSIASGLIHSFTLVCDRDARIFFGWLPVTISLGWY